MSDNDLQDAVSEITEMPVTSAAGHFLASLGWGTLAGAGPLIAMLLVASGIDVGPSDIGDIVGILVMVGVIAGIFTLAGLVLIGLPLTIGLSKLQQETVATYTSIGAIAGFLILAIMFEAHRQPEALGFALIGALAGGACAYRWGRWREALAFSAAPEPGPRTKRPNPIHDLIH